MAKRITKKVTVPKPLRMDERMSKDLELLSSATGRSQNDIICKAVRECFFENRQYFVDEMIQKMILDSIEHDVIVMKENSDLEFGLLNLQLTKTDDADVYDAYMSIKNKHDELVMKDVRQIYIHTEDWEQYKMFIVENFFTYLDLEDEGLKRYFYERFSYE